MALDFSQFGGVTEVPDEYRTLANFLNAQASTSNEAGRVAAERADPFQPYKKTVAGALSRQLEDPAVFQQASERAASMADPFGSYKPKVAEALSSLLSNPGDVTTSPFYQFGRDQGIEAITRANKGVDSGRYMADLLKFGTGYAGQQFGSLAKLYNDILGGSSANAAALTARQPESTAKLYNDILGGSSVGGAQMLMGGFGRAQDQQALAAAGRSASNSQRSAPQGPISQPMDVNSMLARYGINTNTAPPPTGISPPGNYGLPTGNLTYSGDGQSLGGLAPGTGSWSSSGGGGGAFGGTPAIAPGTGSWSSSGGGYGDFGQMPVNYGNFGGMDTSGTRDMTDYDYADYNTGGYNFEG